MVSNEFKVKKWEETLSKATSTYVKCMKLINYLEAYHHNTLRYRFAPFQKIKNLFQRIEFLFFIKGVSVCIDISNYYIKYYGGK